MFNPLHFDELLNRGLTGVDGEAMGRLILGERVGTE